jgi:hypothetical protein
MCQLTERVQSRKLTAAQVSAEARCRFCRSFLSDVCYKGKSRHAVERATSRCHSPIDRRRDSATSPHPRHAFVLPLHRLPRPFQTDEESMAFARTTETRRRNTPLSRRGRLRAIRRRSRRRRLSLLYINVGARMAELCMGPPRTPRFTSRTV